MFWTPDTNKPPLLNEGAEIAVITRIQQQGLLPVVSDGFDLIKLVHQPLGHYLNDLGNKLDTLSEDGPWPARTLKIGACLTMLAYRQSGYEELVDEDALAAGSLLAELGGVPETFAVSASLDPLLVDFNSKLTAIDVLNDGNAGFAQVIGIGSGTARHYLQQAIAA